MTMVCISKTSIEKYIIVSPVEKNMWRSCYSLFDASTESHEHFAVTLVTPGEFGVGKFEVVVGGSVASLKGYPYPLGSMVYRIPFATHGTAILCVFTYMNGLKAYGKCR